MMVLPLPEGWFSANAEQAKRLLDELHRELPPNHVLYGVRVETFAHRDDATDDVLFRHVDEPTRFTSVHLTWLGREDIDRHHPSVTFDGTFDAFVAAETPPRLVQPSAAYERSYVAAEVEFGRDVASFAAVLQRIADDRAGIDLKPGFVAATDLWLVDGAEYIGRVSIRHELTEQLRVIGGHIGYAIRPSRRREGHGTRILQLALPHARALRIDPALATCDVTNIASKKIIERAGGVLATDVPQDIKLRFWIPCS